MFTTKKKEQNPARKLSLSRETLHRLTHSNAAAEPGAGPECTAQRPNTCCLTRDGEQSCVKQTHHNCLK